MSDVEEANTIEVSTVDRIATITLNRPDRRNAITRAMYVRLTEVFEGLATDPAVRVVVLRAEGEHFCSGNDIGDFASLAEWNRENPAPLRFVKAIASFPKAIVAGVQGYAVGVGATMLLHCDLVYVAEDAQFTYPFTKLGLVPEAGSSLLLPMLLGRVRAAELMLLGEPVSADRAVALGLANGRVTGADLQAHIQAQAERLVALPPEALRQTKKLYAHQDLESLMARIDAEVVVFTERLQSPEVMEAMTAFLQKRDPDFSSFS